MVGKLLLYAKAKIVITIYLGVRPITVLALHVTQKLLISLSAHMED